MKHSFFDCVQFVFPVTQVWGAHHFELGRRCAWCCCAAVEHQAGNPLIHTSGPLNVYIRTWISLQFGDYGEVCVCERERMCVCVRVPVPVEFGCHNVYLGAGFCNWGISVFYFVCLRECARVHVCVFQYWNLAAHVGPAYGCVCGLLRGGVWHAMRVLDTERKRERSVWREFVCTCITVLSFFALPMCEHVCVMERERMKTSPAYVTNCDTLLPLYFLCHFYCSQFHPVAPAHTLALFILWSTEYVFSPSVLGINSHLSKYLVIMLYSPFYINFCKFAWKVVSLLSHAILAAGLFVC